VKLIEDRGPLGEGEIDLDVGSGTGVSQMPANIRHGLIDWVYGIRRGQSVFSTYGMIFVSLRFSAHSMSFGPRPHSCSYVRLTRARIRMQRSLKQIDEDMPLPLGIRCEAGVPFERQRNQSCSFGSLASDNGAVVLTLKAVIPQKLTKYGRRTLGRNVKARREVADIT
jgi:hypothetical protein